MSHIFTIKIGHWASELIIKAFCCNFMIWEQLNSMHFFLSTRSNTRLLHFLDLGTIEFIWKHAWCCYFKNFLIFSELQRFQQWVKLESIKTYWCYDTFFFISRGDVLRCNFDTECVPTNAFQLRWSMISLVIDGEDNWKGVATARERENLTCIIEDFFWS